MWGIFLAFLSEPPHLPPKNGGGGKKELSPVGFQVLIALVMKNSILRDITSYNPSKVNQHFRGTCDPHAGLLLALFFDPEDSGGTFFLNVSRLCTEYMTLYSRRQNTSCRLADCFQHFGQTS
jgi:hypothetical protein